MIRFLRDFINTIRDARQNWNEVMRDTDTSTEPDFNLDGVCDPSHAESSFRERVNSSPESPLERDDSVID